MYSSRLTPSTLRVLMSIEPETLRSASMASVPGFDLVNLTSPLGPSWQHKQWYRKSVHECICSKSIARFMRMFEGASLSGDRRYWVRQMHDRISHRMPTALSHLNACFLRTNSKSAGTGSIHVRFVSLGRRDFFTRRLLRCARLLSRAVKLHVRRRQVTHHARRTPRPALSAALLLGTRVARRLRFLDRLLHSCLRRHALALLTRFHSQGFKTTLGVGRTQLALAAFLLALARIVRRHHFVYARGAWASTTGHHKGTVFCRGSEAQGLARQILPPAGVCRPSRRRIDFVEMVAGWDGLTTTPDVARPHLQARQRVMRSIRVEWSLTSGCDWRW